MPLATFVYYYSFIFIGSFGILSSIIGIIGNSMEVSIIKSREIERSEAEERYQELADDIVAQIRRSGFYFSPNFILFYFILVLLCYINIFSYFLVNIYLEPQLNL